MERCSRFAMALTMALAAFGCTKERTGGDTAPAAGGSASAEAKPPARAKVGLVTKTDSNPFFVTLREAARAEAGKLGADFVALAGKFDGDNDGQVTAIENLVQQGVTTILITPNSSTGVLGAIKKARDKQVLVIALDTETDPPSAVDATFATDNTAAGRNQGAYVKAALGAKAPDLIMLDGTPGSSVDTQRHTGFLQGIGMADGDAHIRGRQSVNGDQNKAQQSMENLLQRSPKINAVYTLNEPTARGANVALKAKGLADSVVVGSIDGGCQGVQDVKEGKYAVTVMQFPKKMAELGVDAAVEFAKSGKKPSGFQDTGSMVITDKPVAGVESKDTAWGLENCWK
ncbi:substrate-binding domain-containing protein [Pendulispora rubella]|uniref:Substrate-binding domain-containing protein n=1 Tax=Pendulispora rubella TaxID=2741070 RepID=A0ABZ2LFE2_9BACT